MLGLAVIGCAALLIFQRPSGPETAQLQFEDGDSIARLFARAGLPDGDLLALMEAEQGVAFGLALVPGEEVRIIRREDGRLDRLIFGNGDREATAFILDEFGRFQAAPAAPLRDGEPAGPAGIGSMARNQLAVRKEGMPAKVAERPRGNPRVARGQPDRPDKPKLAAASLALGESKDDSHPPVSMERVNVRNGDSLYRIFRRTGLPQTDLQHLLASGSDGKKLERLSPGQSIAFRREPDGRISRFHHEVDKLTTVEFTRAGDGFTSREVTPDYDRHVAVKNGVIKSSLYADADGVPDWVVDEVVSILDWDIDFKRDIRRGDSFSLLYEELRIDGRKVRTGDVLRRCLRLTSRSFETAAHTRRGLPEECQPVLALEFRSQRAGEPIRAFRYTDSNGDTDYFTPDGRSLRRDFTRNPLQFKRISSRFSKSRLHPVLRVKRPHRGVDYAAPRGTKVLATGDGRVSFVGRKGGYGKTIVLTHGNGYTTLYAHLSRYAEGVRKGEQIKQKDLIGYVGSTGVSTGPHLHYEFRINGVHQNPLRIKLPRAAPLDKKELKRFRRTIGPLVARIDSLGATQLASLDR